MQDKAHLTNVTCVTSFLSTGSNVNFLHKCHQLISGRLTTTGLISNSLSQWITWISHESRRGKTDKQDDLMPTSAKPWLTASPQPTCENLRIVFGHQGERKTTLTSVDMLTHYLLPCKEEKQMLFPSLKLMVTYCICSITFWVKLVLSPEKKWASPFRLLGAEGRKISKMKSKSRIYLFFQEPHTHSPKLSFN